MARNASLFYPKMLFMLNWYQAIGACFLGLSRDSGFAMVVLVLSTLWSLLFESHMGTPLRLGAQVLASASYYMLLMYLESMEVLREELDPATLQRVNGLISPLIAVTSMTLLVVFVGFLKKVNRDEEELLRAERLKVDKIVLSLLPEEIVARLKGGESLIADWRPMAVVCFADIVGFTAISNKLTARQLVEGLVGVFKSIEQLAAKYDRVNKIKTIGDAIMLAGGVGEQQQLDDLVQMADFALGLCAANLALAYTDEDGEEHSVPISFRAGVHCGEVVCGVLSRRRFTFDLLGDTVNTASRMESHSAPGRGSTSAAIIRRGWITSLPLRMLVCGKSRAKAPCTRGSSLEGWVDKTDSSMQSSSKGTVLSSSYRSLRLQRFDIILFFDSSHSTKIPR